MVEDGSIDLPPPAAAACLVSDGGQSVWRDWQRRSERTSRADGADDRCHDGPNVEPGGAGQRLIRGRNHAREGGKAGCLAGGALKAESHPAFLPPTGHSYSRSDCNHRATLWSRGRGRSSHPTRMFTQPREGSSTLTGVACAAAMASRANFATRRVWSCRGTGIPATAMNAALAMEGRRGESVRREQGRVGLVSGGFGVVYGASALGLRRPVEQE